MHGFSDSLYWATGIDERDIDAATEYLKLETEDKEYQAMEAEFV